ncbi:hypothetical protein [Agarilytica rhodophyticola]|uniref:hypothetical protein n=1 Tax=Agarilytica rhodophyticola TaxID=1737490 RepID=UPI001FE59AF8|nr:hypothetical protein [Agarilytica rhodophyticola]
MIKPTKTKAQASDELAEEVNKFLSSGGAVENIPTGISGNDKNVNLFATATHFEPKKDRTSVTEVVQELEARKKSNTSSGVKKSKGPRRKLITDDFGEPIRWVWEEE